MGDIKNFLCGILIGISNAIPGVSGGTMAVILNMYDKILEAVSISNWRRHKRFLAVFSSGMVVGIVGLSKVIIPLRENHPMILGFSFIGLIIGSLPLIFYHCKSSDGAIKPFNVLLGVVAFLSMVVMSFINKGELIAQSSAFQSIDIKMALFLIFSGILGSIAMIIPGISGSLVMLLIGTYTTVMESIAKFNFPVICLTGIGVLIGLAIGFKGIKIALDVFPQAMYFIILGLVAGSIFPVYPGFTLNSEGVVAISACLLLCCICYISARGEMKK